MPQNDVTTVARAEQMPPLPSKLAVVALLVCCSAGSAHAAEQLRCELRFSLAGWSAFYKAASGAGVVACSDGSRLDVSIAATGGGLSFGKSEIHDGLGTFSAINAIDQVLGSYAVADMPTDTAKPAGTQALSKGPISLALSGKGSGWDFSVAFGNFTLSKR